MDTSYSRSRGFAVFGLLGHAAAIAACVLLAGYASSRALVELTWLLVAGLPVWLIALLMLRQQELAAIEALEVEELRREKAATGGGEALFGEGTDVGLRVAQARLDWMRGFLLPAFGLFTGVYLIGVGVWRWTLLQRTGISSPEWPPLTNPDKALIFVSILMLGLFFLSRYAAGLGRVAQWRGLRACGSFTLVGALMAAAVCVGLGAALYQRVVSVERLLAFVSPVLMVVLGLEIVLNFVLDFYRPRLPNVEQRAALDSRLLGLISEPGEIAHGLAEAINYQFGFRVSQTWFFQLLQRALAPLALVGVLAIWLLSCLVVVQPGERVILERFGRQVNPAKPLTPGLHLKLPAPLDFARAFNVDRVEQFFVGYKVGDQPLDDPKEKASRVELWTDAKHSGREHFDFLLPPPPRVAGQGVNESAPSSAAAGPDGAAERDARAVPANAVRVEMFVQYRIDPEQVAAYAQAAADPDAVLRAVAWQEFSRYVAHNHIDDLMGAQLEPGAKYLRERLAQRCRELQLGLEVLQVGFPKVHPEKSVAEAFRRVVSAQLEKVGEIRKARVTENETLSRVAGDRTLALSLWEAIERVGELERSLAQADETLGDRSLPAAAAALLAGLEAPVRAQLESDRKLRAAQRQLQDLTQEFDLGMGATTQAIDAARSAAAAAEAEARQSDEALEAQLMPLREQLARTRWEPLLVQAALQRELTLLRLAYWNSNLVQYLPRLEGEAAVALSRAQAQRWRNELEADAEVTRMSNERVAFRTAPRVYQARRYFEVMSAGLADARKYLLAFERGDRQIRLGLDLQDRARPEDTDAPGLIRE